MESFENFKRILYCPRCGYEREVNMRLNNLDRNCKKCKYFPMRIRIK